VKKRIQDGNRIRRDERSKGAVQFIRRRKRSQDRLRKIIETEEHTGELIGEDIGERMKKRLSAGRITGGGVKGTKQVWDGGTERLG